MTNQKAALTLVALWLHLLCLHSAGAATGTLVEGDGSSNAKSVIDVWVTAYRYARDDISFTFPGSGGLAALQAYANGDLDFVALDRGVSSALTSDYAYLTQFPLAAQAMVMGYNIPELNSTNSLIFDRETLGLVWAGNITTWNHQRIQDLNPDVAAQLPGADIVLGYNDDFVLSMTEVLKLALESYSADFKTVFAAANRTFANMAYGGRGEEVGISNALRLSWVQGKPYGMTFLTWADSVGSVSYARMVNKAGSLVEPSVTSVQAAMSSFEADYENGDFEIDIVDANGTDAWPLALMTHFAIARNASSLDCTTVNEFLTFIAWVHTNDAASEGATQINVAPLPVSFRKKLRSLLGDVQCNDKQAYSTSFLIGTGTQIGLFTSWSVAWSSGSTEMKYYESLPEVSNQQLEAYDADYSVTSTGIGEQWFSRIPDLALLPAAAYAVVPAYNVPELKGLTLVLNFDTIAAIYLNTLTMWNDARIKAINSPEVVAALPAQPITVITSSDSSAPEQLFTYMLSAEVPEFNATVGVGSNVTFPVEYAGGNRSISTASADLLVTLTSAKYSFAFWWYHEVLLTRALRSASMNNTAGVVVSPNITAVESAVNDFINSSGSATLTFSSFVLQPGKQSWPLTTFGILLYRQKNMRDCDDAAALADYFYWTQFNAEAVQIADRQGFLLASTVEVLKADFLLSLRNFTCNGVAVSSVHNCISDLGQLCSNAGTCTNNACVCDTGREGQYCEEEISNSTDATLAIALGVSIPLGSLIFVALLALIVYLLVLVNRKGKSHDDWEIRYDELEVGEHLGTGGFGEVHRATWKGTEVAVKVMASDRISKDMEKSFKDEVRVMTALRHPNVVLFMAASTKAPKMCIVMEFMSLGSLYELLHNELIPELPFALKAKMAYQASKGMHFLHSSGIVHRDLKSLNLLLDAKWNVKVSDFGLTKFKEDVKNKTSRDVAGSVHWTAPEVLNESGDVDFILADVYSFGIILWELLTRTQPYAGMSPAAVAVAVIRDNLRPTMPESDENLCPAEFEELVVSCWHRDPTIRPTFLEIMTRLSAMHGDSTSAGAFTSKTGSSSSSGHSGGRPRLNYNSWTMPSTANSSSTGSSASSNSSKNMSAAAGAATGAVRAPEGEVAIVFTDITRAASLWEFNAAAMRDATLLHNDALRSALKKHHGYEVVFLRDRNSGEGSFCMAFQQAADALAWCSEVQQALLKVEWPEALLDHPGAAEEWGDTDDRVLYKGLRVRMGVHVGRPKVVRDPMTRRVEYIGPVVNIAARITALTHGGQIVLSHVVFQKIHDSELGKQHNRIARLGKFEMPDAPQGAKLYELKAEGLEARFFGGVTLDGDRPSNDSPGSAGGAHNGQTHSSEDDGTVSSDGDGELQTAVGEGMMFKEDTFLTSANLCRWIIDYSEVQVGKQVGLGSYGVVYHGKWKGVEVAVKRFIKQKLDERRMLEFRAEMAFLSELHHPNIVLFIGACVKKPNLCIVTEFMKQGSLKDILANNAIKLTWKQKLRLLRSAALGINYLHSLHPVIVHRDLKPSNLLVDENWNVKVADFGFARIKEENATMTRCGTPCWTAPEIIRGEKYDERADVYSFGVVMWQVVTRKEPYAGRNFMGVSLDVLEGKRPQIPNDCPLDFKKVMKKCWHANADKRPTVEHVLRFLDMQVGDDGSAAAFTTHSLV